MEDTTAKGVEFVADSELEEPGTLLQRRSVIAVAKVHGRYDNVGQFPEHFETMGARRISSRGGANPEASQGLKGLSV